jgi:hypothetical protein
VVRVEKHGAVTGFTGLFLNPESQFRVKGIGNIRDNKSNGIALSGNQSFGKIIGVVLSVNLSLSSPFQVHIRQQENGLDINLKTIYFNV